MQIGSYWDKKYSGTFFTSAENMRANDSEYIAQLAERIVFSNSKISKIHIVPGQNHNYHLMTIPSTVLNTSIYSGTSIMCINKPSR